MAGAGARVAGGATVRGVALVAILLSLVAPSIVRAQEEDLGAGAVTDSVFETPQPGPLYSTVYDRDHSRTNWSQTFTYSRSTPRFAFNGSGTATTQELLGLGNGTTLGNINGRVDARLTKRWIVSTDGRFNMSSTVDPRTRTNNRDGKLQFYTQYSLTPVRAMNLFGSAYTEFQREQVGREQTILVPGNTLNTPGEVDTLYAQRDSSFTTARQDGVAGRITWRIKPWLDLYGSGTAGRRFPTQHNRFRNFVNAIDSTGGSYVIDSTQVFEEKGDDYSGLSRLTYGGLRRSKLVLGYQTSSVNQSRFDQELRGLERMAFDRTTASAHLDSGPWKRVFLTVDGSLTQNNTGYEKRRSSSSILSGRQLLSSLAYSDPITMASVTFQTTRSHTERQFAQTDLVIDRVLGGLLRRGISSRLVLDGSARLSLRSSQFSDPRTDQDMLQSGGNVGGGLMLTRACSTSVHFTVNQTRTVAIDPVASGSNSVQTLYQLTGNMQFIPNENFAIRQTYLISADYKIYDFTESQNFLNRTRRVDTDFADTLLPFAYLRLTHSFLYRDNGNYSRLTPGAERIYRVSLETYEQTLKVGCGIKIVPGVTVSAIQGLFNQRSRNYVGSSSTSTLRNRFTLDAGIDVNRTFPGNCGIIGALRHIGGYDELTTSQKNPNEEDYWIAGATFQKQF
jgi:hypothetical protein